MKKSNAADIFGKAPVFQAGFKNALPAMAAMLMVLIYNLADTFFIGQTHDALQVAGISYIYGGRNDLWYWRYVSYIPRYRGRQA